MHTHNLLFRLSAGAGAIDFHASNMIQPLTFEPHAGNKMDPLINKGKARSYLAV